MLYWKRERARRRHEHGVFARFRYNEGGRPRLRRTRALCKFNGVKERRRTASRLCRSAPYRAACANKLATAKKYLEERG